jgi:hypothetical protein
MSCCARNTLSRTVCRGRLFHASGEANFCLASRSCGPRSCARCSASTAVARGHCFNRVCTEGIFVKHADIAGHGAALTSNERSFEGQPKLRRSAAAGARFANLVWCRLSGDPRALITWSAPALRNFERRASAQPPGRLFRHWLCCPADTVITGWSTPFPRYALLFRDSLRTLTGDA